MQDYVAMVLLWFATSQVDLPNSSSQPAELESNHSGLKIRSTKLCAQSD
jgi:hypothetical protein